MDMVQPQGPRRGINKHLPTKEQHLGAVKGRVHTLCAVHPPLFLAETSVRLLSLIPSRGFRLEMAVAKHHGSTVYSVEATSFRLATKMRFTIYPGL